MKFVAIVSLFLALGMTLNASASDCAFHSAKAMAEKANHDRLLAQNTTASQPVKASSSVKTAR